MISYRSERIWSICWVRSSSSVRRALTSGGCTWRHTSAPLPNGWTVERIYGRLRDIGGAVERSLANLTGRCIAWVSEAAVGRLAAG